MKDIVSTIINEATEPDDLNGFVSAIDSLKKKYIDMGLTLHIYFRIPCGCELNLIKVPEEMRGNGIAKQFMQEFVALGDKYDVILLLSPSDSFGSSKSKLKNFYASFGFKDNSGSRKDFRFSSSMIRYPN